MPSPTLAGLEETLQILIESAERSDWEELDQIVAKLIPSLTAVCEAAPLKVSDSPKATELLQKLQTAIDRCTERQIQISPLLAALSPKTPERP